MDERSNRRLLLLIAGLVIVVLTLAILTLKQFVSNVGELVPWPIPLAVSFNVIVLVTTALITVGHFELRPVAKFLALVLAVKGIETVLTAAGFMLTGSGAGFGGALLTAGLGSWLASVLHAIGALIVAWLLRDVVMGHRLGIEAPPDGLILPSLKEPEMVAGEPAPAEGLWLAPPEPGVDPLKSPTTAQREQAEGEAELDRVVAAAAPATADLETMPDKPAPEPKAEVAAVEEATPPETLAEPETDEPPAQEEPMAEPQVETGPAPVEPEAAGARPEQVEGAEERIEPELEPAEAPAPEPIAESAEAPGGGWDEVRSDEVRSDEILLSISDVLECFRAEDIALNPSEVRQERGGDEFVRVPLDVVVAQIENGVVLVEPDLVFSQLPRAAFSRPPEEIVGGLWQGKVELPLARVVSQVPTSAMVRSYEAEQEAADEFPDPFTDALAAEEAPSEPVEEAQAEVAEEPEPEPVEEPHLEPAEGARPEQVEGAEEGHFKASVSLGPTPEEGSPEPVEGAAPGSVEGAETVPVTEELAAAAPEEGEIEEVAATPPVEGVASLAEAPELAVGGAPSPAMPPSLLNVNAEYIVAQFPENAMAMPIEDIEAKLDPHGKLQVPIEEVLPQLVEGFVAVDIRPLLEQLPPGAIGMSWGELADTLPDGKVELPLEEIVSQMPADAFTPGAEQSEQDTAEEIPEPFEEARPEPAEAARPEEAIEPSAPPEEVEVEPEEKAAPVEAVHPEPVEGPELEEATKDILEISWLDLLPQFPADAFCVSREQLRTELEGKAARIDMHLVRPQLGEGRVTVPCGYLLAQFPDEYLELSIEQIADRMPEGRFEVPLAPLVLQLPAEELALPAEQVLQESAEEVPTVFVEPGAEQPSEEPDEEATGPGKPEPEQEPGIEEPGPACPPELQRRREPVEEEEPATDEIETALPVEDEAVPIAAEAEPESVFEVEPGLVEEPPKSLEEVHEAAEPAATPAETDDLTEEDITQLEGLLTDKRREEMTFEDEGEFIDDLFVSDEAEAPRITMPVLEPEALPEVEEPEAFEAALADEAPLELKEEEAGPASPPSRPTKPWRSRKLQRRRKPVEEASPDVPAEELPSAEEPPLDLAEELPAEARAEAGAPEEAATGPAPAMASLAEAVHKNEAFRGFLHGYAKYHVEHGSAYLEEGRLVLSFTPAETSAEELARELPPRLEVLSRFAEQLGCDALEQAVLTADKGAVVCEWLPEETGGGLVLIATNEKRAAGMMHLEAQRDTGLLSELSAELWPAPRQASSFAEASSFAKASSDETEGKRDWSRKLEPEDCEVAWPDGHPYDEIGNLLAAYHVKTVALLRFASGARWILASSLDLDEHGLSGQAPSTGSLLRQGSGGQAGGQAGQGCYDPGELFELPEALRLGKVRSVLAVAGRNIITVNAPAPGSEVGLICVFPSRFREGFLRIKADKASALLCEV